MNQHGLSIDLTHERSTRARRWTVARLLLTACGATSFGCAEDAAEPADLASVARRTEATAEPTPEPQENPDIHVQAPLGARIVKMKFLRFIGAGCEGARVTWGDSYAEFIELRFDEDEFKAKTRPEELQFDATVECQVALLVRGARGHQVVTQQIDYSGVFVLPPDGSATVTSELRWGDGRFGDQQGSTMTQHFFGPREDAWTFSHSTRTWPAASSKCFAEPCDESALGRCDEDVLYLKLKVQVEAPDEEAWMSLLYAGGSTFTKAPVRVQLGADACTPTTAP